MSISARAASDNTAKTKSDADVKSMRVKSLGPQRKWSITKQAGGKNAEQRDKVSCDLSVLCPHRNKHKKQMHLCSWETTLGY